MNLVDYELIQSLETGALRESDAEHLSRYSERLEQMIRAEGRDAKRTQLLQYRIRPELPPIAYDGSTTTARVLYLSSNPSYGADATAQTHFQPHADWPLSVVGHHIHAPTQAYYRRKVFGQLIKAGVNLSELSQRVLKVELSPWASKQWPKDERLEDDLCNFPSHRPIARLVSSLVKQGVLVVIKSGETHWVRSVPELEPLMNIRVFKSRTPRFPWISEKTYPEGWKPLLAALVR